MGKIIWKVVNIIKETKSTNTFVLKNETPRNINYQVGQFLTFLFNSKDGEIRRSYSMSSSPGIDKLVSITVKRVPNGEISRHLINHVHINDTLISIQPAGRFTIDTNVKTQRQFIFISAGTGIVPVFSLIKKILKEEPLSRILLIDQNHDESEIIFRKQLEEKQRVFAPQFKWISLLSKLQPGTLIPQKLNNFLLEKIMNEQVDREKQSLFYLCGPLSFMRMAQFTLKWMGFTEEQIKKENFTIEEVLPPPLIMDKEPKEIVIHYNDQTFRIKAVSTRNILQAALNEHISLPYSCRSGICSTCIAKCMKGKVKMSNNEVLTEKDVASGWVLTCVGYAETDVELEF